MGVLRELEQWRSNVVDVQGVMDEFLMLRNRSNLLRDEVRCSGNERIAPAGYRCPVTSHYSVCSIIMIMHHYCRHIITAVECPPCDNIDADVHCYHDLPRQ